MASIDLSIEYNKVHTNNLLQIVERRIPQI